MNLFVKLVVNCPLSYITYDLIILLKIFIIYRWNVSIISLFLFLARDRVICLACYMVSLVRPSVRLSVCQTGVS